jgi:hypothetical protein
MPDLNLGDVCNEKRAGEAQATQRTGKDPIDGIFVSNTLLNSRCGFLGLGDGLPGSTIDVGGFTTLSLVRI